MSKHLNNAFRAAGMRTPMTYLQKLAWRQAWLAICAEQGKPSRRYHIGDAMARGLSPEQAHAEAISTVN